MKTLTATFGLALCASAQAKIIWQDASLTYLNGSEYELGDNDRQVFTFEHTAATSWGDSFLFVDRIESDNGFTETYGELSPRLQVTDWSNDWISGLYVATTWEFGDGFNNYLIGPGIGVKAPGFDYLNFNLYRRSNEFYESNYQLTTTWGLALGPLYYDGFIDWSSASNGHAAEMNFTSQLKYNIAPLVGLGDDKLYVGIEYVFWNNKFGIDGIDERNANLLIKYHF
ncbi:nucleoside-binding protein [Idiomarina tyrosinivorans]|uniref:Nucleoside-binding protein n=1 Tax=Idiomarina tyrosinivorans TaxID=1445662 RepID=A0A432ZM41_9GAMM|nr:nucleoside-binding protein [Idiomarina tyrosinivorans]